MNSTDVFVKTAAGVEEVKSRGRKLPQRLRTLLILIDGTLTAAQLQAAATKLGAPPDVLDTLVGMGLIAVVPAAVRRAPAASAASAAPAAPTLSEAERFSDARKFMNDTVVEALGIRAFLFTLKLEKCFNRTDLLALLPAYAKSHREGQRPRGGARARGARARTAGLSQCDDEAGWPRPMRRTPGRQVRRRCASHRRGRRRPPSAVRMNTATAAKTMKATAIFHMLFLA